MPLNTGFSGGGVENIVFLNDLNYGPINGFEPLFEDFSKNEADFYGYLQSFNIKEHVQSFFYMFKKEVFSHKNFKKFLMSVKKQSSYGLAVEKYEMNFSKCLKNCGFSCHTFVPSEIMYVDKKLDKNLYPLILMKYYNSPFLNIGFFDKELSLYEYNEGETLAYVKEKNPELYDIIVKDLATRK